MSYFKIMALTLLMTTGCAAKHKRIRLDNIHSTIEIHRANGWEVAKACGRDVKLWGCAIDHIRFCEIWISDDAPTETVIHELAHCAGWNEEMARKLSEYP